METRGNMSYTSIEVKRLRDQRNEIARETRRMADMINGPTPREFTADETKVWDKLDVDYRALTTRIETAERASERDPRPPGREDTHMNRNGEGYNTVSDEDRCLALQGWTRACVGKHLLSRHERAIEAVNGGSPGFEINLRSRDLELRLGNNYPEIRQDASRFLGEKRALSAYVGTSGAYTIPQGFMSAFEVALLSYANIRQICDVIRTDGVGDLPWPTMNDSTNKGAILPEGTTVGTSTDPVFGQEVFKAYKYSSKLVLVPYELLEDNGVNFAKYLGDALGTRIGRIQADHFTTGTGAGQPTGFMTLATLGKTAASATLVAFDEILALKHSVDPAYRPGAWAMNDSTLLVVKQLKDGVGRYLLQPAVANGAPMTIDGDPVLINQSMASIGSGSKSIAYGQFQKYKIRDAGAFRLRQLGERYADTDQVGFIAFQRSDGNLLDAGTHPIKYLAHP